MSPSPTKHFDPRGLGSMLQLGDTLNLVPVMFFYRDGDGKKQYTLGLSDKTQVELDTFETAYNNCGGDAKKEDEVLNQFKAVSFSTFFRQYIIKTDKGLEKFKADAPEMLNVLNKIVVDATTSELTYAFRVIFTQHQHTSPIVARCFFFADLKSRTT